MSTSTLKERKEAFVSGLRGTSITEIYLLSAVGFSSFLLRCSLLVCLPSLYKKACNSPLVSISIDFGIIIFPVVLVFTVLADYVVHLLTAEILISGVILWNVFYRGLRHYPFQSVLTTSYPKRQPYLTLARTSVNLFTAIAILAVDFSIFPRRLAKTETYGSGLMDIGVGAFLMAHGLTSPESRQHHSADSGTSFGYLRLVATTLKQVLPLLLLGLLRVMVIKSMGYQEHVTEYGVHWNFFFTIATVRLICSLLYPLLVSVAYGYGIVAMVVALSYQALLQWAGLESYVLFGSHGDGSRIGLISANREGLVSCAGYFVIYAGWIQIGKWLLRPRMFVKELLPVLLTLSVMCVSLWAATNWSVKFIQPISRRLTNLPYILWMFSYEALILSLFLTVDITILAAAKLAQSPRPPPYAPNTVTSSSRQRRAAPPPPAPLCVMSAVDYNQLGFFLMANMLTGLVNYLVDTLHTGPIWALVVMVIYMATLQCIFTALHTYKIKLKF